MQLVRNLFSSYNTKKKWKKMSIRHIMAFVLNVAFQWKFNALICPNYWVLISTMRSQSSINRFPFLLYLEKCLIPDRAILGVRCENSFALPTNICKVLYVQILWVFQFKQGKKRQHKHETFFSPTTSLHRLPSED